MPKIKPEVTAQYKQIAQPINFMGVNLFTLTRPFHGTLI